MRHDDTTYMDDEDRGFVVLDDEENEGAQPVTVTAGGRQWSYSEEAWGGWAHE